MYHIRPIRPHVYYGLFRDADGVLIDEFPFLLDADLARQHLEAQLDVIGRIDIEDEPPLDWPIPGDPPPE
jgi:hypothetical protein